MVHKRTETVEARRLRIQRQLGLAPPEGSPWVNRVCFDGVRQLAVTGPAAAVKLKQMPVDLSDLQVQALGPRD